MDYTYAMLVSIWVFHQIFCSNEMFYTNLKRLIFFTTAYHGRLTFVLNRIAFIHTFNVQQLSFNMDKGLKLRYVLKSKYGIILKMMVL